LWIVCPGWPQTSILLISAFQIARVTDLILLSHESDACSGESLL
jgi:hypothetical protein